MQRHLRIDMCRGWKNLKLYSELQLSVLVFFFFDQVT